MSVFASVVALLSAAPVAAKEKPLTDQVTPIMGTVSIAAPAQALSFARFEKNGKPALMLVESYQDSAVTGKDLSTLFDVSWEDPISLFQNYTYAEIQVAVENNATLAEVGVPVDQLLMPVRLTDDHIAAGTNFPAHAEEATVEDGPFLFPKRVVPTHARSSLSMGKGLLDFEVELCFVAIDTLNVSDKQGRVGLLLCNDFTDREKLMHHLGAFDVTSGKGFTTGKSAPGFMPIGNLFVVPQDHRAFLEPLTLTLYHNGELAQQAIQSEAIWDYDDLLEQIKLRSEASWAYQGEQVSLALSGDMIAPRTAILAGTPDGTLFKGLPFKYQILGVMDWVFGGWNKPVPYWIVNRYVDAAKAEKSYLQAGDRVEIHVEGLGEITTTIVP
ncbi:MAG: 2-keto-4-pentenoate hydratase/2-oxohepta-3-ene-1,7-dioic acid hydratase in catechol pathway [Parvibaculaceae bacterium]|jgi:2,4-diketo-3-deoxy-L-fuconate hydrolase